MSDALFNYLAVGAVLFSLGAIGFLTRRNLIILFLSAELMLQGVALNLIAFGRYYQNMHGQVFAVFVLTVAACEAAIAMAVVVVLYQRRRSLDVSIWSGLTETDMAPVIEAQQSEAEPAVSFPDLPTAGRRPRLPEKEVANRV